MIPSGNHNYVNRASEPLHRSFRGFVLFFLCNSFSRRDHAVFYVGISHLPE